MSRYAIVSILFLSAFIMLLAIDGMVHIPLYWFILLVILFLIIKIYGVTVLSAQFFVPVLYKAKLPTNTIAITFDDGPIAGNTERVLDILKEHNIKSTFFCIGSRAKENPNLLKRIVAEGHALGNHTYWHGKTFDLLPSNRVEKELIDTNQVIQQATGVAPRFFRPPYGVTNPMIARAVTRQKYTVIGWSVRSFDTIIKDKKKLFNRVTRQLKAGDIVLFHDYSESMLGILPEFLMHVNKLGLKVVRVDELLNERAYR
jgi:peptidoglycan-N-acetylglucosamine deacetylase